MIHTTKFNYRGLAVTAQINEYWGGDWENPPEGGDCFDYDWEVADIDELLRECAIGGEGVDQMIRALWRITGRLPVALENRIDLKWQEDITRTAEEYSWD